MSVNNVGFSNHVYSRIQAFKAFGSYQKVGVAFAVIIVASIVASAGVVLVGYLLGQRVSKNAEPVFLDKPAAIAKAVNDIKEMIKTDFNRFLNLRKDIVQHPTGFQNFSIGIKAHNPIELEIKYQGPLLQGQEGLLNAEESLLLRRVMFPSRTEILEDFVQAIRIMPNDVFWANYLLRNTLPSPENPAEAYQTLTLPKPAMTSNLQGERIIAARLPDGRLFEIRPNNINTYDIEQLDNSGSRILECFEINQNGLGTETEWKPINQAIQEKVRQIKGSR